MIQANLVERVLQCQTSLDFVSFDHSLKDLFDGDDGSVADMATSTVRS